MAGKLSKDARSRFAEKFEPSHDDGPLVKALERFDKTDAGSPVLRLQALEGVVDQIKKPVISLAKRKEPIGDKPFAGTKDKLHELPDGAEKLHKETQHAMDANTPSAKQVALADWKVQRAAAIASLKAVAAKIAGTGHRSSARAILEIQAVIKNLTAEPSTPQQVTDLRNYIGSDNVVHDVSELADDIRTPLLAVLDRFQARPGA